MESNEFDGAFKKKEPVRAPRRRRLEQEADEDADSVRRATLLIRAHARS